MGERRLPGRVNYFTGRDPRRWRRDVPTFARVRHRGVYPGVDLVYYGNQGQLEYDFVVAAGADPGRIRLGFDGARGLHLDAQGNLHVRVPDGDLVQHAPRAYQSRGARREPVPSRFVVAKSGVVRVAVGRYDRSRPLTIDPVLSWSTYLGGEGWDHGRNVAVDGAGDIYVATTTASAGLADGGYDTSCGSDPEGTCNVYAEGEDWGGQNSDVLVTKLDPTGSRVIYSSYFGGGDDEDGKLAVDSLGRVYIAGYTTSHDLPTTPGAPATRRLDDTGDGFVARLGPNGDALEYSTYLGGAADERPSGVTVDAAGEAVVTGWTDSQAFPLTDADLSRPNDGIGTDDAFVVKVAADGRGFVYAQRFGGSSWDEASDVALDAAGNAYVVGSTHSLNFPVSAGAADTTCSGRYGDCDGDAFALKVSPSGSLVWSTLLGGTSPESAGGVAVDSFGNVYVGGSGAKADFPGAVVASPNALANSTAAAWVAKLDATGTQVLWSTLFGGSSTESVRDVALAPDGSVYAVGGTWSQDFPALDAPQRHMGSGYCGDYDCEDAFVARVTGAGALDFSTFLGGGMQDEASGVAIGQSGNPIVTGTTRSGDFPVTQPMSRSLDQSACDSRRYGCWEDAFLVALDPAQPSRPVYDDLEDARQLVGATGTVAAANGGATAEPGEPDHAGTAASRSVWFDWTAPTSSAITFAASGGFPASLDVYTGDGLGSLERVAQARTAAGETTFQAEGGRTYRVAVDAADGTGGDFTLAWSGAPPDNDDLADARAVSGRDVHVEGNNAYATQEPDEPRYSSDPGHSVWFRWVAPSDGELSFDWAGTEFSAALRIYTSADGGYGSLKSYPSYDVTAGTEYLIAIDGRYPEYSGEYSLSWHLAPRPANDDFANAQEIGGSSGSVGIDTRGATRETGEPDHDLNWAVPSVWYRWTAPADGTWIFEGGGGATPWIYSGSAVNALKSLGGRGKSATRVGVSAGQTVYVALANEYPAASLSWRPASDPPANDAFANASELDGEKGRVRAVLATASREIDEPASATFTAWYRWTAPADGRVELRTLDGESGVYTGDHLSGLTRADSSTSNSWGTASFNAVAGETYRIALREYYPSERPVTLQWNLNAPPNDAYESAQRIDGVSGTVTGDNVMATDDAGSDSRNHSVWYAWTPSASGQVDMNTRGSTFDASLDVYTGSTFAGKQEVAHDDDVYANPWGHVSFDAQAGTTYVIGLANRDPSASGDLALHWNDTSDDPEPPQVHWLSPAEDMTLKDDVDLQVDAFDNVRVARVEFWVGNQMLPQPEQGYDWYLRTNRFPDGPITVQARVFDKAGNEADADRHFVIDNTAPQTDLVAGPAGRTSSRAAAFTVASSEPGSDFRCQLDGGGWRVCGPGVSYDGVSDGEHVFQARARDGAGNWDVTPAERRWIVDPVASPETAPANTSAPAVSGSPEIGEVLAADAGSWAPAPDTYRYQWLRCAPAGDGCGDVAGARDRNYTIGPLDAGRSLRVRVVAANAAGSGVAQSAATPAIASAAGAGDPPEPETHTDTDSAALPADSGTPAAIPAQAPPLVATLGTPMRRPRLSTRRALVARPNAHGVLALHGIAWACPPGGARCVLRVRSNRVAAKRAELAAGRVLHKLRVRLTHKTLVRLRRHRTLRATFALTLDAGDAGRVTRDVRVTLRRPR